MQSTFPFDLEDDVHGARILYWSSPTTTDQRVHLHRATLREYKERNQCSEILSYGAR